jgi:hypothetical protein
VGGVKSTTIADLTAIYTECRFDGEWGLAISCPFPGTTSPSTHDVRYELTPPTIFGFRPKEHLGKYPAVVTSVISVVRGVFRQGPGYPAERPTVILTDHLTCLFILPMTKPARSFMPACSTPITDH